MRPYKLKKSSFPPPTRCVKDIGLRKNRSTANFSPLHDPIQPLTLDQITFLNADFTNLTVENKDLREEQNMHSNQHSRDTTQRRKPLQQIICERTNEAVKRSIRKDCNINEKIIERVDGENGSYMKSINGAYKKQRKKKRMYRDGLTFVEGRNENAPVYRLQSFFDNILYKRQMERHLQSREMVVLFLVSYNKFRKNKIFTKFLFSKNKLPSPF